MGKPGAAERASYECLDRDGVTVWRSTALAPTPGAEAMLVDLGRILWFRRAVLKNARTA